MLATSVARLLPAIALILMSACTSPGAVAPRPVGTLPLGLDVIFVPSDLEVVTAMLELANVGPDDVVYDLGCGDGRIVIAAASRYGARGVGVDLDPERIREAQDNAARAGVTDKVTFLVQDLFATDVRPATVVALYLGTALNVRLRPKLLRELQPGSRVVSNDFDMRDWPPERTVEVPGDIFDHRVFLWTIPGTPEPRSPR